MAYCGFWRRFGATVIDLILMAVVAIISVSIVLKVQNYPWAVIPAYIILFIDNLGFALTYLEGLMISLLEGFCSLGYFLQQANMPLEGDPHPTFGHLLAGYVVIFGIFSFYNALMETTRLQGSLGKFLLSIKVVSMDNKPVGFWQALGRNAMKFFSIAIFFAGYIMIVFSKRRQGWHDRITGTVLVTKSDASQQVEGYPKWC